MYIKPWTINQLKQAMLRDLGNCSTQLERTCCEALCGREIREKAEEWAMIRKLTPGEIAIASEYGYTP